MSDHKQADSEPANTHQSTRAQSSDVPVAANLPKKRSAARILLPILFLVIGGLSFKYLSQSKQTHNAPPAKEKIWQVQVQVLKAETLAPQITIRGRVEASDRYTAASPGAGWVEQVNVREGDHVQAGAVLLALDPRDFRTAITQAEAELAEIAAQLAEAAIVQTQNQSALLEEQSLLALSQKAVARSAKLKKQSLSSESAVEEAQRSLKKQQLAVNARALSVKTYDTKKQQFKARQNRANAQLAQAERALVRSKVIAPYDGIISSVEVTTGARVNAGQSMVSLYALDQLELRAFIPKHYVSELETSLAQIGQISDSQTSSLGSLLGTEPLGTHSLVATSTNGHDFELVRLAGEAQTGGIDAFLRPITSTSDESSAVGIRPGELLTLNLSRPAKSGLFPIPAVAIYDNSRVYLLRDERLFAAQIEVHGQISNQAGKQLRLVRGVALQNGEQLVLTRLPNATTGLKAKALGADPISGEG